MGSGEINLVVTHFYHRAPLFIVKSGRRDKRNNKKITSISFNKRQLTFLLLIYCYFSAGIILASKFQNGRISFRDPVNSKRSVQDPSI